MSSSGCASDATGFVQSGGYDGIVSCSPIVHTSGFLEKSWNLGWSYVCFFGMTPIVKTYAVNGNAVSGKRGQQLISVSIIAFERLKLSKNGQGTHSAYSHIRLLGLALELFKRCVGANL
jgi:hypothetical protein